MEISGTRDVSRRNRGISCKAMQCLPDNNTLLRWHVLRTIDMLYLCIYAIYVNIQVCLLNLFLSDNYFCLPVLVVLFLTFESIWNFIWL